MCSRKKREYEAQIIIVCLGNTCALVDETQRKTKKEIYLSI